MAEIHVEAKKKTTPSWIWVIIVVVVLGIVAYIILHNRKTNQSNTTTRQGPTSFVEASPTSILVS